MEGTMEGKREDVSGIEGEHAQDTSPNGLRETGHGPMTALRPCSRWAAENLHHILCAVVRSI